jgi:Bacterial SH3 domain
MFLEKEQEEGYPATVKIVAEESSVVVSISLKATWGTFTSPNLCGFYDELHKNVKQASARTQIKQLVPSSQKPSEEVKESPLPPPSHSLPSPPPLAPTPKISLTSLPRGKIIWVYVNLREGPGIQYRIIGKAYKENTFEILAENLGWLWVRLENRAEGWVSKKAAATEPSIASSPQSPPASSPDSSKTGSSPKQFSPM